VSVFVSGVWAIADIVAPQGTIRRAAELRSKARQFLMRCGKPAIRLPFIRGLPWATALRGSAVLSFHVMFFGWGNGRVESGGCQGTARHRQPQISQKIYYGSNLQPQQKITKSRAEPISWNRRPNELFGITGIEFEMVLPDRIELSTSPFITPALSRPPRGVCALDHPFIIGPWGP